MAGRRGVQEGGESVGPVGYGAARDAAIKRFQGRIWRLLTAKGWTQSELARRADVGKDMISTYVRGRHLPDANNAKKLADAFGITVEELFPEIAGADPTPIDTPFELRAIPGTTDKVFVRVGIAMEMSHSDAIRLLRLTQSGVLPDA